ncbi:Hypothetical predicted protein [Mytilus galloprovincialis]|uniref:C-type lectin domain-containing protein n=1 Tax=Mytilus galloprovincialis TaxID=29158 RepID=A0A8B6FVW9_MYTGA|nr:Hypothetical predicted protein [Mytilus galloprovincialis]
MISYRVWSRLFEQPMIRQNVDIWFGVMKSDNSTWLAAKQDNCEDVISVSVKNTLPPLTSGVSQCMVLNMSGSGDDDLYYAASCEELYPFLCQSQDIIGHFGAKDFKRNYAVMLNVSWAEAFDRCTQNINSGRLFNRPLAGMDMHLQHDRSVLKQKGWQNGDTWLGIMKRDNTTWLAATQDNCEDIISDSVMNTLPPLTPGISQCLLLNMSGSGDNDIYYTASCDELHPFLCQSQVHIGTVNTTMYSEMMVKRDLFNFVPTVRHDVVNEANDCLVKINNKPAAFAAVYNQSKNDCKLYVHNPTVIYPVRVQMENHSNVTSFVKTKGHEGINYRLSSNVSSTPNIPYIANTTTKPVTMANPGTANEMVDCVCVCKNSTTSQGIPISLPDLRIDKTTLSSHQRRFISVADHRLSATMIGLSGALILTSLILAIIVPDFILFAKHIKHHYNRRNPKH